MSYITFLKDSKEWQAFKDKSNKYGGSAVKQPTMENNPAVAEIFGTALETKEDKGQIGRVIIDDIYFDKNKFSAKVFNHVKIDRFTGGAWDGALFQEKALAGNETIAIRMLVKKGIEPKFMVAFEAAIKDLKTGHLALGGATAKGYGAFTSKS